MNPQQGAASSSVQSVRAQSTCTTLPGVQLTRPFRPSSAVFKVSGKMFAVHGELEEPNRLTLKCDPDYGALLMQQFEHISPGYHMNKHHWITIDLDGSVPTDLICELIVNSYDLVVATLAIDQRPSSNRLDN